MAEINSPYCNKIKLQSTEATVKSVNILCNVDLTDLETSSKFELCSPVPRLGQGLGCTFYTCVRKSNAEMLCLRIKLRYCVLFNEVQLSTVLEWRACLKSQNTEKHREYETIVSTFHSQISDVSDYMYSNDVQIPKCELEEFISNNSILLKWNVKLLSSQQELTLPRSQTYTFDESRLMHLAGISTAFDSSLCVANTQYEFPGPTPSERREERNTLSQADVEELESEVENPTSIKIKKPSLPLSDIGDSEQSNVSILGKPNELQSIDHSGMQEYTDTHLSDSAGCNFLIKNYQEITAINSFHGGSIQLTKEYRDTEFNVLNKIELSDFDSDPNYEHFLTIPHFHLNYGYMLRAYVRNSNSETFNFRLHLISSEIDLNVKWPITIEWVIGISDLKLRKTYELAKALTTFERQTEESQCEQVSQELEVHYNEIKDFLKGGCLLLRWKIKILSSKQETTLEKEDLLKAGGTEDTTFGRTPSISKELKHSLIKDCKDKFVNTFILTNIYIPELDYLFEILSPIPEIGQGHGRMMSACVRKAGPEKLFLRIKLCYGEMSNSLKWPLNVEWRVSAKNKYTRKSKEFEAIQTIFTKPKFQFSDWTFSEELIVTFSEIKDFVSNNSILLQWKIQILSSERMKISSEDDRLVSHETELKYALDKVSQYLQTMHDSASMMKYDQKDVNQRTLALSNINIKSFEIRMNEARRRTFDLLKVSQGQIEILHQFETQFDEYINTIEEYADTISQVPGKDCATEVWSLINDFNYLLSDKVTKHRLNILLIGRNGNGKGATGNTILRKHIFESNDRAKSQVLNACVGFSEFEGRKLKVVDSPGFDGNTLEDFEDTTRITKALECAIEASPEGYHAVLYVIKYSCLKCIEELVNLRHLNQLLGSDFMRNHGILVVTCDELFDCDSNFQKENLNLADWIFRQIEPRFSSVIEDFGDRVLLFDNRSDDEKVKRLQIFNLIQMIDVLNPNSLRETQQIEKGSRGKEFVEKMSGRPYVKDEYMRELKLITFKLSKLTNGPEDLKELHKLSERSAVLFAQIKEDDQKRGMLHFTITAVLCVKTTIDMQINNLSNVLLQEKLKDEETLKYEEKIGKLEKENNILVEQNEQYKALLTRKDLLGMTSRKKLFKTNKEKEIASLQVGRVFIKEEKEGIKRRKQEEFEIDDNMSFEMQINKDWELEEILWCKINALLGEIKHKHFKLELVQDRLLIRPELYLKEFESEIEDLIIELEDALWEIKMYRRRYVHSCEIKEDMKREIQQLEYKSARLEEQLYEKLRTRGDNEESSEEEYGILYKVVDLERRKHAEEMRQKECK